MALLSMTLSIGCISRVKVGGGGWTSSDGTKCIAVNGYSALGTSYLLPTTKKLEVLAYGPIDESGNRTLEARKMFTIKQAADMTWTCVWESETVGRIFVFDYANVSRNAARKNGTPPRSLCTILAVRAPEAWTIRKLEPQPRGGEYGPPGAASSSHQR